jgi:hypothetical protein
MPEEIEVETSELQEAIDELHKERSERVEAEKATGWTKYIGLTTALLAVFAAVGALRSGSLVNEAMIDQLKASDKWNEYQAARQKTHLYSLQTNSIIDRALAYPSDAVSVKKGRWSPKTAKDRAKEYEGQVEKEESKAKDLSEEAKKLEKEAAEQMHGHHLFAQSVAFIQVAIALGAISALTKIRLVWIMSIIVGAVGLYLCIDGLLISGF